MVAWSVDIYVELKGTRRECEGKLAQLLLCVAKKSCCLGKYIFRDCVKVYWVVDKLPQQRDDKKNLKINLTSACLESDNFQEKLNEAAI